MRARCVTLSARLSSARALAVCASAMALLCACMPGGTREESPAVSHMQAHEGSDSLVFDERTGDLISAGWNGEIAIWQADGFAQRAHWKAHRGQVEAVAIVAGKIASASRDGDIAIWAGPDQLVSRRETGSKITEMAADGGVIVTGHMDGKVRAFAAQSLKPLWTHTPHNGWIAAVAANPARPMFATVGADRRVYLYSARGHMRQLDSAPGGTWALAFSADGATLYGGGFPNLYVWSVGSAQQKVGTLETEHYGQINGLIAVPKAADSGVAKLVSISRTHDSSVVLLDAQSGRALKRYQRLELCGNAVAVSADGRFLAATGDAGHVRIWPLGASAL